MSITTNKGVLANTVTGDGVIGSAVGATEDARIEEGLVRTNLAVEEGRIRANLAADGHDLPELAETMEDADARAASSSYLFAMRNLQREVDANGAEFTALLEYTKDRHVARQGTLVTQIEYLRSRVRFLFGFMTVTGKKKSLNLLGGRVGMRAKQDELVVADDEEVIAWANANGVEDLVRMKMSLDRTRLRKHMGEQSDVPPGVELRERDDEFFAIPATD